MFIATGVTFVYPEFLAKNESGHPFLTVNPEGVDHLHFPGGGLREHGEHVQELVEVEGPGPVLREHFADSAPEGVLLKRTTAKHCSLNCIV